MFYSCELRETVFGQRIAYFGAHCLGEWVTRPPYSNPPTAMGMSEVRKWNGPSR